MTLMGFHPTAYYICKFSLGVPSLPTPHPELGQDVSGEVGFFLNKRDTDIFFLRVLGLLYHDFIRLLLIAHAPAPVLYGSDWHDAKVAGEHDRYHVLSLGAFTNSTFLPLLGNEFLIFSKELYHTHTSYHGHPLCSSLLETPFRCG